MEPAEKVAVRLEHWSEMTDIPMGSLRDIAFYAKERVNSRGDVIPGNGFAPAFLRLGRAVYVIPAVFMRIWHEVNDREIASHERRRL